MRFFIDRLDNFGLIQAKILRAVAQSSDCHVLLSEFLFMRRLVYSLILWLPLVAATVLILSVLGEFKGYIRDLGVIEVLGDSEFNKGLMVFLLYSACICLIIFVFSKWGDFVDKISFPLEQSLTANYEGWAYWAPNAPEVFSVQHFPEHSNEEHDKEDLRNSWCVLGNSFHCILMSSDRFRFSLIQSEDDDKNEAVICIDKRAAPGNNFAIAAKSSSRGSKLDLVMSDVPGVEGGLPNGLKEKVLDAHLSEFAAEYEATTVGIDYPRSKVFAETINNHRLVAASIVFSVTETGEDEDFQQLIDQTEYQIFSLHISNANAVYRLEVVRIGDVSDDLCEFTEKFLRGMSIARLGYLWQSSACAEGFLKKLALIKKRQ